MSDVVARAQREHNRERAAVMRHTQMCRWCLDGPCPRGQAIRTNADAYGRHLAMLAARAAIDAGIAWA